MRRSLALVVVLAAGCGRLGFDPGESRNTDIDASGDADDDGAVAVDEVQLITIAGSSRTLDALPLADGAVAFSGAFEGTVTIEDAPAITSTATVNDLFVAVVEPDNHTRAVWTGNSTVHGEAHGLGVIAGEVVLGGYFAGTLANAADVSAGGGQDIVLLHDFIAGPASRIATWGNTSRNVQLRGFDLRNDRVAATGVYSGSLSFGVGSTPSAAVDNAWIAVFNADIQATQSAAIVNTSGENLGNDIALANDGGVCVTGRFAGGAADFGSGPVSPQSSDAFVARYSPTMSLQWVRTFGAAGGGVLGEGVAVAPDGDCVAAITFNRSLVVDGMPVPHAGMLDGLVIRLDGATGTTAWIQRIAGPSTDQFTALAVTPDDRVVVGGWFSDTATVIATPTTAEGISDGIVLVLAGATGAELSRLPLVGSGAFPSGQLGGLQLSPDARRAAFAFAFTGDLRVGERTATSAVTSSGVVVLPL